MTGSSVSTVTLCTRRRSIPIPAVSRSLRLGFHSSDSYGYHFRSKPAHQGLVFGRFKALATSTLVDRTRLISIG